MISQDPPSPSKDIRTWTTIHFVIGIIVPVAFFLLTGCNNAGEESATVGTEVPVEKVASALEQALAKTDPYSTLKEEAVLYRFTQQIETSPPTPYVDLSQTVLSLEDTDDSFKIVYQQGTYDYETGEEKYVEKELEYPARPSPKMLTAELFSLSKRNQIFLSGEPIKTTFHDLAVKETSMEPPEKVKQRNNCGGVPNCVLRITKIQYDQIDHYDNGKFDKIRFNFTISGDTPYMGRLVHYCEATEVPYEGRVYYLKTCQNLEDFIYGKNPHE